MSDTTVENESKKVEIPLVNEAQFEEQVLKAERPVLVDFYADWCGPCKFVAPVMSELAGKRDDIMVVKVNVDEDQALAQKYGVAGIPMLVLFKEGKKLNEMVGAGPIKMYEDFLDSSLKEE